MKPDDSPTIEFHEQAAARFSELAQDLLAKVRTFGRIQPSPPQNIDIHPVMTIAPEDISESITMQLSSINALGEESGRFWDSAGYRVGWEGADFEAIKQLASRLENSAPLQGCVSTQFVLDEVFTWLRETLEQKRNDKLTDHIAARCSAEIRDHEIWVPVYRTYSAREFFIGGVQFRTISKSILDRWYARIPKDDQSDKPDAIIAFNRERSALQGTLAACANVRAELNKAIEKAHAAADEAVALLRFLSPVNWTCRIVSHCLPLGRENTRTATTLFVDKDEIQSIRKATLQQGPAGWSVDESCQTPLGVGILEHLHQLALNRSATEFRADLYGALQLHARHSVAAEIAHKIVFVVAAAESLFLKDPREPIQKNLGERMAFLIGNTLDERRSIIQNVDEFYNIRSGLIHHGRDVRDDEKDIVDKFFFSVWLSFARLLTQADQFQTRNDMFTTLENKKLS